MSVKQVFNTSAELDYPTVLPTLDLDFANSKTLDPRIDFTRASGGSYVGADGLIKYAGVNEPRFDHDPETGESLGLLIEESRTNLLDYSEDFTDSNWNKNNDVSVSLSSILSPNGESFVYKIVEDSTLGAHNIYKGGLSYLPSNYYTFSVYAKLSDYSTKAIVLRFDAFNPTSSVRSVFSLETGSLFISSGSLSAVSNAEKLPNNWYRFSISTNSQVQLNNAVIELRQEVDDSAIYQGDGTSGIYLWGAQLEVGSFPTSYIPTEGSTRTRSADNAEITGKNFTDFYNQNEGSVYCDFQGNGNVALNIMKTSSNRITLETDRLRIEENSIVQVFYTNNLNGKNAFSLKQDDVSLSTNGTLVYSDNSMNINGLDPVLMRIGMYNESFYVNGHISKLTYYPKRLPNSQLIALTE